jgi:hypothetical protein
VKRKKRENRTENKKECGHERKMKLKWSNAKRPTIGAKSTQRVILP